MITTELKPFKTKKVVLIWLLNIIAPFIFIALYFLPTIIEYYSIYNEPDVYYESFIKQLLLVWRVLCPAELLILAFITLWQGPRAIVNELQDRFQGLQGKTGNWLGLCWALVMLVLGLLAEGILFSPFYEVPPSLIMLTFPILLAALPACGLLTAIVLRSASSPLPKKYLLVISGAYLLSSLLAMIVYYPLAFFLLLMVGFGGQGFTTDFDTTLNFYFAGFVPTMIFYGISGALGSVFMLRRLNHTLYNVQNPAASSDIAVADVGNL